MLAIVRKPYLVNVIDIVVAAVLLAVVGYAAVDATTAASVTEPVWVSVVTATLVAGPIAPRRAWPVPMLAVSLAATVAATVSGVIPVVASGAPATALAILLYTVASQTPRRRSVRTLVACFATVSALVLANHLVDAEAVWDDSLFGFTFTALAFLTAWTLGFAARERRRHAEESATRRTEQAVAEERLRIARELHDIVAHSMSVIAVKAGIGNHVAEARPEEAREALRVIEATSRGSLNEMRHLLGVLRSEVDTPAFAPAPGPAGIPALVERARAAGVTAELTMDGTDGLSDGVGLSVYRIVQEAVTNVVRHAAPARCAVTVTGGAAVRVEVVNDGPRVDQGPGGHGLIGMRERVAVYGGTFAAGPRAEGGWRVFAELPL